MISMKNADLVSTVNFGFEKVWLFEVKKIQWKGINHKQSTRWQHLSRLKASAFFSLQIFLVVMKHSNLYLGLVLPSGG
jgi:hypothetical protein